MLMRDGRELCPPASLERMGFALKLWPSKCADLSDDEQVVATYYDEVRGLVKEASGAVRACNFDRTSP